MTLAERLAEYVRACFPALWVRTHEPDDALEEIARACNAGGWSLATWDLERGLEIAGDPADPAAGPTRWPRSAPWPRWPRPTAPPCSSSATSTACLGSAEVVQALEARINAGKRERTFVVVLAPVVQIPVELERQFAVIEHDLPGRDDLLAIARGVATEPGELREGPDLDAVLDAAAGLTRTEAENSFALSLVRHGRLAPDVLWELKGQALKAAGLLSLHRGGESFADLGGLGALKSFCAGPSGRAGRRASRPRRVGRGEHGPAERGAGRHHRAIDPEADEDAEALGIGHRIPGRRHRRRLHGQRRQPHVLRGRRRPGRLDGRVRRAPETLVRVGRIVPAREGRQAPDLLQGSERRDAVALGRRLVHGRGGMRPVRPGPRRRGARANAGLADWRHRRRVCRVGRRRPADVLAARDAGPRPGDLC